MSTPQPIVSWPDRLPTGVRLILLLVTAFLSTVVLAFAAGITIGVLDSSGFGPRSIALLGTTLLVAGLLTFASWQLSAYWRRPDRSRFDRRYTRMWVILLGLSLPLGMFFGAIIDQPGHGGRDLFSNAPLPGRWAILAAIILLLFTLLAFAFYHRTIDAHEEHALLWANTGGYYSLFFVLPTFWLLERGGLIGPFGLGTAMLLLLASCAVQFLIWAWLKFH